MAILFQKTLDVAICIIQAHTFQHLNPSQWAMTLESIKLAMLCYVLTSAHGIQSLCGQAPSPQAALSCSAES